MHRSVIVPLIADRATRSPSTSTHKATDQGVLFAIGDITGGMVLYIEDGRLHLVYNGFGEFHDA